MARNARPNAGERHLERQVGRVRVRGFEPGLRTVAGSGWRAASAEGETAAAPAWDLADSAAAATEVAGCLAGTRSRARGAAMTAEAGAVEAAGGTLRMDLRS